MTNVSIPLDMARGLASICRRYAADSTARARQLQVSGRPDPYRIADARFRWAGEARGYEEYLELRCQKIEAEREEASEHNRERYQTDPDYRERVKRAAKERYKRLKEERDGHLLAVSGGDSGLREALPALQPVPVVPEV